jgi:hypothetical protein
LTIYETVGLKLLQFHHFFSEVNNQQENAAEFEMTDESLSDVTRQLLLNISTRRYAAENWGRVSLSTDFSSSNF